MSSSTPSPNQSGRSPSPQYLCHAVGAPRDRGPGFARPLVHVIAGQPFRRTLCGKYAHYDRRWTARDDEAATCPACLDAESAPARGVSATDGAT